MFTPPSCTVKESDDGFALIFCVVGVPVMVIVKLAEVAFEAASVAVKVKFETSGVVGVPAMEYVASVFLTRARPSGRAPAETRNEGFWKKGVTTPPVAETDCRYACSTMPLGNDVFVILKPEARALLMLMEKFCGKEDPALSVTVA